MISISRSNTCAASFSLRTAEHNISSPWERLEGCDGSHAEQHAQRQVCCWCHYNNELLTTEGGSTER